MSKAPSMPMYWDAYLSDTTHLTTEEHGAYLLLLAAMWRRDGSVPDDDKDNARILGLTVGRWRKIKARLQPFLTIQDGAITQKNLQKIWENTQEKIATNKKNGARGGRPKHSENNDLDKANGFVSDNRIKTIPEPEPEPDITHPYGCATGKPVAEIFWDDCLEVLRGCGKTERQARSLLGKWTKGNSRDYVRDVVEQSRGSPDPVAYIETTLKPKPNRADAVREAEKRIRENGPIRGEW